MCMYNACANYASSIAIILCKLDWFHMKLNRASSHVPNPRPFQALAGLSWFLSLKWTYSTVRSVKAAWKHTASSRKSDVWTELSIIRLKKSSMSLGSIKRPPLLLTLSCGLTLQIWLSLHIVDWTLEITLIPQRSQLMLHSL